MSVQPPGSTLFPYTTLFRFSICQAAAMVGFILTQDEAGLFAVAAAFGLGVSGIIPAYVVVLRDRSEEHTSELQSHSDLVCRLLLEKKNPMAQEQEDAVPAHDA